ncbi:MAG: alpha/beta fold hydrolase [Calditrichaeota bacterium]|nr:alpha/beta fold hydrolase [Calditrichota bacterium]
MSYFGWVVGAGVLLWLGTMGLILLSFRNPRKPHSRTPAAKGLAFEEVRFPTRGGKALYGWFVPAQTEESRAPALILVHGWGRNVERMLPYMPFLHAAGYHLLAFDARCHGSSDKDGYSTVLKFAEDIRAATDYLSTRPEVDPHRLGVLGLSIGGAASILATAWDPRLKAAVTVGAFAHPADMMRDSLSRFHLPYIPVGWSVLKFVEWRVGRPLDDIAPENAIRQRPFPLLLVHGDADKVVPVEHAYRLYRAANRENVELWIQPGRGHSNCHLEPGFNERVAGFFESALQAQEAVSEPAGGQGGGS